MFRKLIVLCIALAALALLIAAVVQAGPAAPRSDLSTAFTYQGQLNLDGQPVDNTCDFQFSLYDDELGNVQVGTTQTITEVAVRDGLFTVQLDFGAGAFQGDARWLGIHVQCVGDATTSDMGLQALTATPYALYATSAPWDGIIDMPAGFADGVDNGAAYQNVVVVAKSGGDYTAIQAAIDSIGDASAGNAYLVWVAPGVYSETVTMKPYVHVQGAGQAATVIHSSVDDDVSVPIQATLILTDHVTLRDLTVDNSGGDILDTCIALMAPVGVSETLVSDVHAQSVGHTAENYAIYVMGDSGGYIALTLQDVNALAENATDFNIGVSNFYQSSLTLRGGRYVGRGGDEAYGITNTGDDTVLRAENVIALGEGGMANYALANGEAVAYLLGGHFTARGWGDTYAIFNYSGSTLQADGVVVLSEGAGTYSRALQNSASEATLNGGSFTAFGGSDARGIFNYHAGAVLRAVGVTALGQDSVQFNYGLYNKDGVEAYLQGGAFTGRGGTSANGLYNSDENTLLEAHEVAALGENGSIGNRGLYNVDGGRALLYGGSFVAYSGGSGILNHEAVLEANNVYALGEGETSYNQGLINTANAPASATAILHGGSFIARDASYEARGIYAWGDLMTLEADGIFVMAEDGDENYGLVINSGTANVTQSTLEASDYAAYRNITGGSVITISNSRLVDDTFGTITCVAVTAGTTFYENTCP